MKPVEIKPWRKSPFVVGQSYKVLRNFKSLFDSFQIGEILKYEGDAYSHYHGFTGYFFSLQNNANGRRWDIHDNDNLEIWKELFEEVKIEK